MANAYQYHRPGIRLEFYTEIYDYSEQHVTAQASELPKRERNLIPINAQEPIQFEQDVADIRRFAVNTPTGNTIGTIEAFLADTNNMVIPYAYIRTSENRSVIVPTNQLMMFPDRRIVTLEGGIDALRGAPEAEMNENDAARADRYWSDYRRRNAA